MENLSDNAEVYWRAINASSPDHCREGISSDRKLFRDMCHWWRTLFHKSSMLTNYVLKLKHSGFLQKFYCPFLSIFWVSKNEEMTLKGLFYSSSEAVSSYTISQMKGISMICVKNPDESQNCVQTFSPESPFFVSDCSSAFIPAHSPAPAVSQA